MDFSDSSIMPNYIYFPSLFILFLYIYVMNAQRRYAFEMSTTHSEPKQLNHSQSVAATSQWGERERETEREKDGEKP